MTKQEYSALVSSKTDKSPMFKDCLLAFLFGGAICCLGEVLKSLYGMTDMSVGEVRLAVSCTLIFLTAVLTGLGLFEKIAKIAGAGTFVPITGFANSVVSPALEFNVEGKVMGTGAKMFGLAGPVIAYGCSTASIYGLIVYFCNL